MTLPTTKCEIEQDITQCVMIFYGDVGVGKTQFVNNVFKNCFFISTDRGTRDKKALRKEVTKYQDISKIIKELQQEGAQNYDAVCFDLWDDVAYMIESYVCEKFKIEALSEEKHGKGWKAFKDILFRIVRAVLDLKLSVVFIAHPKAQKIPFMGREINKISPKLGKNAGEAAIPIATLMGYCYIDNFKIDGKIVKKRMLLTQPTEEIEAKDKTKRKKPVDGIERLNGSLFRKSFEN